MKQQGGGKTIIFTDGSRDPVSRRAGFGVYIDQSELEYSVRVSDQSSVFTTELYAILWAVQWVEQRRPKEVVICSDSAAALEALKVGKSKARPDILMEILNAMWGIGRGSAVTFCWVPGHTGIEGNEKVDRLAKDSLLRGIDRHLSLGRVELRGLIKEGVVKEWQEGWEREDKGRHYFMVQPKVIKTCFCNAPRRDAVKLCRLRLGHCGLNKNLFLIGKHDTGLCECGQPETVKHVFLQCSNYNAERQRLFISMSELGVSVLSLFSLFGHSENHQ